MTSKYTTLTQKGQITVPLSIRKALGLKPKDMVSFELQDGVAILRPVSAELLASFGAVRPHTKPEDFKKLRDEFERGVAADVAAETASNVS